MPLSALAVDARQVPSVIFPDDTREVYAYTYDNIPGSDTECDNDWTPYISNSGDIQTLTYTEWKDGVLNSTGSISVRARTYGNFSAVCGQNGFFADRFNDKADGVYTIAWGSNSVSTDFSALNDYVVYFQFSVTGGSVTPIDPVVNTTTRIDTVTPQDKSTIATSTDYTQGATGYVSDNDYKTGTVLKQHIKADSSLLSSILPNTIHNAVCLFGVSISQGSIVNRKCGDLQTPITSSGAFSYSTTTVPIKEPGRYTLTTEVDTPYFSLFGLSIGSQTLVSTTTRFLGGATTTLDSLTDSQFNAAEKLLASGGAEFTGDNCNFTSGLFDVSLCLQFIILPSGADIDRNINDIRTGLLSDVPWGYATRVVNIITASSTASTTLPTWSASFETSSTSSSTLTFDMGDMFTGGATLLNSIHDNEHGLTMRQILEPWIQLFIAISVLIIIFFDVMAMGHHTKPSPKSAR